MGNKKENNNKLKNYIAPNGLVRDFRKKPFAWQDKEALRMMRDHFSGKTLSSVRNLYLGLTEIASDNASNSFKPQGGNKTIKAYTGLTKKSLKEARQNLLMLNLIMVFDITESNEGRLGYYYVLIEPNRDEKLTEPLVHKVTLEDNEELKLSTTDSPSSDSRASESRGHLEDKVVLEDRGNSNNSSTSLSKEEINKIITKWSNTVNQINNNLKERDQDIRMSRVRDINYSTRRYRHLKQRLQENSFDFDEICNALLEQDFCWGLNDRTWQADFDWLIKNGENYVKVLEKKFRSNSKPKHNNDKDDVTEGGKLEFAN